MCRAQDDKHPMRWEDDIPMQRLRWGLSHTAKGQGRTTDTGVHCCTTSLSALLSSRFSMEIWVQPSAF